MDFLHLPLLAVIAQSGNMSTAARALKMHESKLSRLVKSLELEAGMELVVRHPALGANPLTKAGCSLLEYAQACAVARQQARLKVKELSRARNRSRRAVPGM